MDCIDIELKERYRTDIPDSMKRSVVLALQGLYQVEVAGIEPYVACADVLPPTESNELLTDAMQEIFSGAESSAPLECLLPPECDVDLAKRVIILISCVCDNRSHFDYVLSCHLDSKWKLDRLGVVERNVLRIGACLIKMDLWTSLPTVCGVCAQCAVEYGSPQSHGLITAVLDAVASDHSQER